MIPASKQLLFGENKITLAKSPTGWQAIYTGPHAASIVGLFETNSIPTAFTSQALAADVLSAIRKLNPTVNVVVL